MRNCFYWRTSLVLTVVGLLGFTPWSRGGEVTLTVTVASNNRRDRKLPRDAKIKSVEDVKKLVTTSIPTGQQFQESMDDCDFMVVKHEVRLNGPCICGSEKIFMECCGRGIADSLKVK